MAYRKNHACHIRSVVLNDITVDDQPRDKKIHFRLESLSREYEPIKLKEAEEEGYLYRKGLYRHETGDVFADISGILRMFPGIPYRPGSGGKKKIISVNVVNTWMGLITAVPAGGPLKGAITFNCLKDEFSPDLDRLIEGRASASWSSNEHYSEHIAVRLPRLNLGGDGMPWYSSQHVHDFFERFEEDPVLRAECLAEYFTPAAYYMLSDWFK